MRAEELLSVAVLLFLLWPVAAMVVGILSRR